MPLIEVLSVVTAKRAENCFLGILPRIQSTRSYKSWHRILPSAILARQLALRNNYLSKIMRVLLTGGSGFVAAHCLEYLLKRGHTVVTTVRSHEKGQRILDGYRQLSTDQLSYVLVEDIAARGAFDEARWT
ncbi:hypothetical protein BKA61DRAFT_213400 [Leptodontidium sp. MPI-SDFR-AT-0119]|nr:hypothetical protein BKA61DRAFT_213400 [Leptodontidium sp. MPI-SDFR-AT-0119]